MDGPHTWQREGKKEQLFVGPGLNKQRIILNATLDHGGPFGVGKLPDYMYSFVSFHLVRLCEKD